MKIYDGHMCTPGQELATAPNGRHEWPLAGLCAGHFDLWQAEILCAKELASVRCLQDQTKPLGEAGFAISLTSLCICAELGSGKGARGPAGDILRIRYQ